MTTRKNLIDRESNTSKVKNRHLKYSFIMLCLRYFLIYSILLAAVYFFFSFYTSFKLNHAFISIKDIVVYHKQLETDSFADLPSRVTKNCSFVVFNRSGQQLYSSSREIGEKISFDLTDFILDYADGSWYSVSENITSDGQKTYIVMLKNHDSSGNEVVLSFCLLDENYHITRGNLFSGKGQLTENQFNVVKGSFSREQIIQKYSYQTTDGEERILISVCPQMSNDEYARMIEHTQKIWYFAIPVVLAVIMIETLLFAKKIKKSIVHINTAIHSYQSKDKFEVDQSKIPYEFLSIVDNFNDLLGWMNDLQHEKENMYKENRQMIADISHDLKTPLTVIRGYAKALSEGRIPEEKKRKYLDIIYEKSMLSADLIDSLFDCVKMEHPNFKLDLEEVDLCEYVKEVLAERYNEIEENGFDIDVQIPEETIPLSIDKNLFKRLLGNLLNNSLQYNPPGTTIFVSLKQDKKDVVITIADNGTGISPELADDIFKPFVTSNNARSSGKGTGLGLTITKKIVELHGGSISLCQDHSNSHLKTVFIIKLPKHNPC